VRVGYIVPSLDDTTGWGRWANDFLRHIAEAGVASVVLAPPSSARHKENLTCAESHFVLPEFFDYLQSSTGARRLPALAAFRSRLDAIGHLDLVHSFDGHPWGLYGDWLARRRRVPHLLTTHGRYGYIAQNRWLDRVLYRGVLSRSSGMVAVSEAVRRSVVKDFEPYIKASKISVMQNPVDQGQFQKIGALPPQVPSSGPLIISVTRFIPVKDIETAVKAFGLVKKRWADASFCIVGPGNGPGNAYFQHIRQLINSERIEGIHVIGRVPKDVLAALYSRASLLVHTARTLPDDFEASGLILLEAGLMGLPVVATASGGIPEVVSHGTTGLLVGEGDYGGLAESVCRLLGDHDLRRRLGEGNRERALQRNWSSYTTEQFAQYDQQRS